jgi:hypothetical protein
MNICFEKNIKFVDTKNVVYGNFIYNFSLIQRQ